MIKRFTKIPLSILSLSILTVILISCTPNVTIETWHPRDIIGQGTLIDVDRIAHNEWSISLALRRADTGTYETIVYSFTGELDTSAPTKEGGPIDVNTFVLGRYYILYQKYEGHKPKYALMEYEE